MTPNKFKYELIKNVSRVEKQFARTIDKQENQF